MKIIFRTNIDHYINNPFPTNLTMVPRKGETVLVNKSSRNYYVSLKLPTRMEVVDVVWDEDIVIVELHYKKHDIEMAKILGIELF